MYNESTTNVQETLLKTFDSRKKKERNVGLYIHYIL